jgi:hypothetical protein
MTVTKEEVYRYRSLEADGMKAMQAQMGKPQGQDGDVGISLHVSMSPWDRTGKVEQAGLELPV